MLFRHDKQPVDAGMCLIWLLCRLLEFSFDVSITKGKHFLFLLKILCFSTLTMHDCMVICFLLFAFSIVFPLLSTTLWEQICDPFLGHDPPVEKCCVKTFTACSNRSFWEKERGRPHFCFHTLIKIIKKHTPGECHLKINSDFASLLMNLFVRRCNRKKFKKTTKKTKQKPNMKPRHERVNTKSPNTESVWCSAGFRAWIMKLFNPPPLAQMNKCEF